LKAENVSTGLSADLSRDRAKMQGLETELAKTKKNLQTENDEHNMLRAAIRVICDDLEVVQAEGTSSLVAHIVEIKAWVRALERNALHASVL
jgi:hypothetical protein